MKPPIQQFYLVDISGKEVWSDKRKLDDGTNIVSVFFPTILQSGEYILHIRSKYGQLNTNLVRGGD